MCQKGEEHAILIGEHMGRHKGRQNFYLERLQPIKENNNGYFKQLFIQ